MAFHAILIGSILAALAILAAICAACQRKPKKAAAPPPTGNPKTASTPRGDSMVAAAAASIGGEQQEDEITELEGEIHGAIYPSAEMEMSNSKRRLSASASIGLQGRLSRIRTARKERRKEEEETLWKKTIIMGEKNKAPPWEEDEDGSCGRNYRPRSLPVSPIKWVAGDEVPPPPAGEG